MSGRIHKSHPSEQPHKSPRILFAGGGTGGHIYPALAIADAVKRIDPSVQIDFVGTPAGLESKLVPRAGYKLHFISIGRLHHSAGWFERIRTMAILPFALLKSFWLLLRLRPTTVAGVGGYASGPIVLAAALLSCARLMRIRTFIWEPNAYPGLANRILARFVGQCLVVFSEAGEILKSSHIAKVHMPVRHEIEMLNGHKREVPPQNRESQADELHLLVFGGSQGARPINEVLVESVVKGGQWLQGIRIVHQTGRLDYERLKNKYSSVSHVEDFLEVHEYLHDMPDRLAWADLVIVRAGTGTISELAACGKPAILVPLPTAADDHQTKNAQALVNMKAAIMIAQRDFTPERLMQEITALKNQRDKLSQLAQNISRFHRANAAGEIAKILLSCAADGGAVKTEPK